MSVHVQDVYRWAIEQIGDNIEKRDDYGDVVSQWMFQQDL